MIEKKLFQEYSEEKRLQMLKDNCNKMLEEYGYEKPLSKDQLKTLKDKLSSASVNLHDVQEEKKEVDKGYNDQIKDLKGTIADSVKQLKTRTTYTCELCFEFLFRDERKIGVYNKDGVLIEERPASLKELREPDDMFRQQMKTGTNN